MGERHGQCHPHVTSFRGLRIDKIDVYNYIFDTQKSVITDKLKPSRSEWIPYILRNQKDYYRIRNSQPLDPIVIHINLVHTNPHYSLKTYVIVSTPLSQTWAPHCRFPIQHLECSRPTSFSTISNLPLNSHPTFQPLRHKLFHDFIIQLQVQRDFLITLYNVNVFVAFTSI